MNRLSALHATSHPNPPAAFCAQRELLKSAHALRTGLRRQVTLGQIANDLRVRIAGGSGVKIGECRSTYEQALSRNFWD